MYTAEEIEDFRRAAEKEAARKAAALTKDERETLVSLVRENVRRQGQLPPQALRQWASELLGRELPYGELYPLVRAQLT